MSWYAQSERLLNGTKSRSVRVAFAKVDRAKFVPADQQASAWADHPLPIEDNATISQPSLVAEMTEWLDIQPESRVLEIGTGSGYQTAILAELAKSVHTIEFSELLAQNARTRLQELGYKNITFRVGDGALGWHEAAPFDRIIATVSFSERPAALLPQLTEDGICIAPVGPIGCIQSLTKYLKEGSEIYSNSLCSVRFLSLR
jgi:protein-L-isoaspartate(D-aspartate) O-methyltransferase